MKFRSKWDKLYEVYQNNSHLFPFDDSLRIYHQIIVAG